MNLGDNFDLWLIITIGVPLILIAAAWWNKRGLNQIVIDTPMLLTMITHGMGVEKLADGQIDGYPYSLLITSPPKAPDHEGLTEYHGTYRDASQQSMAQVGMVMNSLSDMGSILLSITLPVKSPVHIAGFGIPDAQTHQTFDRNIGTYGMEVVGLEGDFPDYFSLYCQKGQQMEVRQVLDPATMAFLVDFCQTDDWELMGDTLYFCERKTTKGQAPDNSSLVADAQTFVKRALPTLQRMNHSS